MGLEKELEAINKLKRTSEKALEGINEKTAKLKEKILGGESTGDIITDFIVVAHNSAVDERCTNNYRKVEERIKCMEGAEIFVSRIAETESSYEAIMYLGILDSENLSLSLGDASKNPKINIVPLKSTEPHEKLLDIENIFPSLVLPVSNFVVKKTGLHSNAHTTSGDKWEKIPGARVKISYGDLGRSGLIYNYYFLEYGPKFGIQIETPHRGFVRPLRETVIQTGKRDIVEFFKSQRVHDIKEYENAVKILNRKN